MSLLLQASKGSMPFLGQWLRRVSHAETEKKEKREKTEAFRPCGELKQTENHSAILVWVSERAKHRRDREKHSESERVKKRKKRHFFFLKLHVRKINWWSSHGVFECYNHGELEYSEENFITSFAVILYLLFEIYLLYIQFIVDSSLT